MIRLIENGNRLAEAIWRGGAGGRRSALLPKKFTYYAMEILPAMTPDDEYADHKMQRLSKCLTQDVSILSESDRLMVKKAGREEVL